MKKYSLFGVLLCKEFYYLALLSPTALIFHNGKHETLKYTLVIKDNDFLQHNFRAKYILLWFNFSYQCQEIEENNRMGKTRDLSKKIRDNKGIFHAKMGSIQDRNGTDLTEAEDFKKRWQDTQKNYIEKIFMTQIITMV